MQQTCKTIADESQYEKVFSTYYQGRDLVVRDGDGTIQARFHSFKKGFIILSIAGPFETSRQCIIYAKIEETIISTRITLHKQISPELYAFIPGMVQIHSPLNEGPCVPDEPAPPAAILAVELLSETSIIEILNQQKRTLDNLKAQISERLSGSFDFVRIRFINESTIDARMNYFGDTIEPIIIDDVSGKYEQGDGEMVRIYRDQIYPADREMQTGQYQSEISVPILYRALFPFGYIQVNKREAVIDEKARSAVRKIGASVSNQFVSNRIFTPREESFSVENITKESLDIILTDRKHVKLFKERDRLLCTIVLQGTQRVLMMVRVGAVEFTSGNGARVSCCIKSIDALGEVYLDEYTEHR
jgi:hypothetical protein